MNKVVLITGCSSGFGFGMALKFAREGYATFATVRNIHSEGAEQLKTIQKTEHLPLTVISLDVANDESVTKGVQRIYTALRRIDILINNAGYGYLGPLEETPLDDIRSLYETNIFGTLRMIKSVVPIMRKQKSGLIVNFSSLNGVVPFPLFSSYSSSKFAIETLTEGLRFELRHFGIQVTMVEPGSYLTNFSKNRKSPQSLLRKDSPYKNLIDHFFTRYKRTHDVKKQRLASKVADPQEVVDAVFSISQYNKPKLRYRIGNDAHKYYFIRKLLPAPLWEWLLHKTYKW